MRRKLRGGERERSSWTAGCLEKNEGIRIKDFGNLHCSVILLGPYPDKNNMLELFIRILNISSFHNKLLPAYLPQFFPNPQLYTERKLFFFCGHILLIGITLSQCCDKNTLTTVTSLTISSRLFRKKLRYFTF